MDSVFRSQRQMNTIGRQSRRAKGKKFRTKGKILRTKGKLQKLLAGETVSADDNFGFPFGVGIPFGVQLSALSAFFDALAAEESHRQRGRNIIFRDKNLPVQK